jgi:hypothetical protein
VEQRCNLRPVLVVVISPSGEPHFGHTSFESAIRIYTTGFLIDKSRAEYE